MKEGARGEEWYRSGGETREEKGRKGEGAEMNKMKNLDLISGLKIIMSL